MNRFDTFNTYCTGLLLRYSGPVLAALLVLAVSAWLFVLDHQRIEARLAELERNERRICSELTLGVGRVECVEIGGTP